MAIRAFQRQGIAVDAKAFYTLKRLCIGEFQLHHASVITKHQCTTQVGDMDLGAC